MSPCNAEPPPEHPMSGMGLLCPMIADHTWPHAWDYPVSMPRLGLNRLLAMMPTRELESLNTQTGEPFVVRDAETGEVEATYDQPPGPWWVVTFVGGDGYAIWKETGSVYRIDLEGAVEEDPWLTLDTYEKPSDEQRIAWRRLPQREHDVP